MRRGTIPLVVLLGLLLVGASTSAATAVPSPAAEDDFTARIAGARAGAGLAGYSVAPDLVDVARRHAEEMARQDRLFHNPRLTSDVKDWDGVGENVGSGETVADIHRAFMESSIHRDEILHKRFTQVGIGVVERDGVVWVVQVFRRPSSPAPAPAAPPRSAPPRQAATTLATVPIPSTTTTTTVASVPTTTPVSIAEETLQSPPASELADRPTVMASSTLRRTPTATAREVTSSMAIASTLLVLVVAALAAQMAAESRRAAGVAVA